jgi:hypothetical protein
MADKGEIDHYSTKEERHVLDDGASTPVNRWIALVEITRLLINSGHPNLAFAAICVLAVPIATIAALLVVWLHR